MDVTWRRYYGIIEKLSLFTGVWPYLKPRTRRLRVGLITMIAITVYVPQIAFQVRCNRELQCILTSISDFAFTVIAIMALYTFSINISKIKYLIENLFVDWKEFETSKEIEIFKSHARFCKRFSLFYSAYCFLGVYGFMSVPLVSPILDALLPLNESRPLLLPISVYYFVDPRKNLLYICGYAIFSCGILMVALLTHDCMFVTFVEHVCCMFAVLGSRFECLFCNSDNAEKRIKADSHEVYRQKVAKFVRMHRKTLEFVKVIENTFTVPFAAEVMIIVVAISCTLLQITQQKAGAIETTRYACYVMGQLFHLFCLSFEGQKLIDHSFAMRDKIYNSFWYEAPLKSQKLLIMTMIQSLQPTSLSAGKIYVFSLQSYTAIVQTSMSYFTVLASFR